MLDNYVNVQMKSIQKSEIKKMLSLLREKLEKQQILIKEKKLPVIVLFEGWGAGGKGSIIGRVIRNIDPRFFSVEVMKSVPSEEEIRRPFLYRFFKTIPEEGRFAFLDSGWMDEVMREKLDGAISKEEYNRKIQSIKMFERQLTDNGYLVIKLFFHITQEEQEKRLKLLEKNEDTKWRVSQNDLMQNKHYSKCLKAFDLYLTETNTPNAPWYIIDGSEKDKAELQVLQYITEGIDTLIQNTGIAVPLMQNTFPLVSMPKLSDIDMDKTLKDEDYKKLLKEKQSELSELHNKIYRLKMPVIILYEGWDAAGKGGNIRRLTDSLDPRGYEVIPVAAPEPHEKNRHYLWRFWTHLPKDGHIAIFDRSWYGRVMVERIENFCTENEWQRAYNEINEFEKEIYNWGAVIIKFWVHIDMDTQLIRFNERQNSEEKKWKITDEDWRNREKWNDYEIAVDEMLQKTSTEFAPWNIIVSNDKKYARIKALDIVINSLKKVLN